jgi:hypothetical protein
MSEFYVGKYAITNDPLIDRQAYCLPDTNPLTGEFLKEHFAETSNPEELIANPEAFKLLPLETQGGACEWGVTFSVGEGEFEQSQLSDKLFYPDFYLGAVGKGRRQQPTAIAISNFYPVPVESGSAAGSREILEFC